ncbi:relaxase/mobilization nuclease domain-containing protein [Nocardia brasiliensis]|uniref:relaxase/mobilization nuclease domain-containing protein n=1 Tax=Nocardia brasiliensis TaxID=37326 RepID=UPI00340135C7
MIPKIRRGAKIGGLMVYLLGEGEHNEHRDRHIIAGSPTIMRKQFLQHFDGPADKEAARETALAVAHVIDIPRKLYGTQVRMKAKPVAVSVGAGGRELGMDVIEPAGKGERSEYRDAPVWHCVLSLMPGEELDDAKWAQVTNEFMVRMGFVGTKDGYVAHARWAAVRHGHSGERGEGQDHIHIAASLVREDGSKVSTFDYGPGRAKGDWKRAQQVAGELEHEFGLKILASRAEGGGLSGNSRAERERAQAGTGETERERLRRAVRAAAVAAEDETGFVQGLRDAGIAVRPRYATGSTSEVTGYSVRWRRDGSEVGPWVGGGKLAKDLTLSALREQQWDDSPEGRAAALTVWKARTGPGARTGRGGGENDQEAWQRAAAEAGQWQQRLGEIPYEDRAQWAWMAGQAAGVFAAWSEVLEGDQPGAFAAAAKEMTRSSQVQFAAQRWRPTPRQLQESNPFADAARLILSESARAVGRPRSHRNETDEVAAALAVLVLALMLLVLLAAIAIVAEIARAHRARGELGRAMAVEQMHRQQLGPVQRSWEAERDERLHRWDRDSAAVFAAAAGRAARRHVDEAATTHEPEPAAATEQPEPPQPERKWPQPSEGVVAAASGPLTPPQEQQERRAYYTELSREDREAFRARAVGFSAMADYDLTPQDWPDDMLAAELAHVRTEVRLLSEELDKLRDGDGVNVRQALADNELLTRLAETIPVAKQARKTVEQSTRELAWLGEETTRLTRELADTSWVKAKTRSKLAGELAAAEKTIGDLTEALPEQRADAEAAAAATGVPASEWDELLHQSTPDQQRLRLTEARAQDREDLTGDANYLPFLQADLAKIEDEHNRRAALTPEQRASEVSRQTRNRFRGPQPGIWVSEDTETAWRPPERGPETGQGLGM